MTLGALLPLIHSLGVPVHRIAIVTLALLLPVSSAFAQANPEDRTIDLRLFGKNIIEEYDGCRFALWQANKDPAKDPFSYVFFAPYTDGEELPAWMKVADTVYTLHRQDKTVEPSQRLEDIRLYRSSKGTFTLLVEILEQHLRGDDIVVDKGRITLTRSERYPFVVTVKGGVICPQMDQPHDTSSKEAQGTELYGDPVRIGPAQAFDDLETVPAGVMSAIKREAPDCDPSSTTGFGASYAISDGISLWEVPCNLYARTGSSVFLTSMNGNADYSTVLTFPPIPNHGDTTDSYEIRAPQIDPDEGTLTSTYLDGDGSCGSQSVYQLRAVEGEALEFFLIEYREKPTCDGKDKEEAERFPLIFSAH